MTDDDPTRDVVVGIVIEQWRNAQESLNNFGQRIYDELVDRPNLLVRMLRIPRPGPCGHLYEAPAVDGGSPPICTLDTGHTGCHMSGDHGAIWREIGDL